VNRLIRSLILLLGIAGPALAQPGGVTVLRGQSGESSPGSSAPHQVQLPKAIPPRVTRQPAVAQPIGTASQPIGNASSNGSLLPAFAPSGAVAQAIGTRRPLTAPELAVFTGALKALDGGRYADARAMVADIDQPLLKRYVEWSILRSAPRTDADFVTIWRFLRENPDWPEPEILRRQAEDRIGPEIPMAEVWNYFLSFPPLTSAGLIRRLDAAITVDPNAVARLAGESWRTGTFRPTDEADFLTRYGQHLAAADNIERFDRLLREGQPQVARELVPRLPSDYQPLANARLAMTTRAADAVTVVRGLAGAPLNEPNVRLEQIRWLRQTGNLNDAKALLSTPTSTQNEAWWNERHQLARDLLAAGRAADAYVVSVPHGQIKGASFAEAEFLAGWIALRHLGRADDSLKHFQKLYDGVNTDISKSRAAYWLGRAHEAAGRPKDASEWYARAAGSGQTFYGQLAARKLPGTAARLPNDPVASTAEGQNLADREFVNMARYLGQAGEFERTRPFLLRLARMVTAPGEISLLAQLAVELKRPDVAITIAHRAVESGVTLFDTSFPVVDLGATGAVERALALALVRQESAFNAGAVSPSGALGLMQLMPGTARDVAGRAGVPFLQDNLTRDPAYNVTLGSRYFAEMLQRFSGSYELALAAYNAGPNSVARWLESIGDPRSGKIDMVDWIEMIPFRETRNYVQRVMEGVGVYRDRLNGPFRTVLPATNRS